MFGLLSGVSRGPSKPLEIQTRPAGHQYQKSQRKQKAVNVLENQYSRAEPDITS